MHSETDPTTSEPDKAAEAESGMQDWSSVVESDSQKPRDTSSTATSWTLIHDATDGGSPTMRMSRDALIRRYWSAVYAFIRSSGRSESQAEDLTQGFFCDVVLGRDLFNRADSTRGRFRSLLLSAVRNYLADDYRMRTAKRRSPGPNGVGSLDDENGMQAVSTAVDPESAFNNRWVDELIRRTTEQIRVELTEAGQLMHWDILESRILSPCLTGADPIPHDDLATKWNLKGLPQVSNLLVTAKRKFARALLDNVRDTLPKGASASNELNELFKALGTGK